MHGEIHVNSTQGVGSTFTFKIRVQNATAVSEPDANIDPRGAEILRLTSQLGQPRILMVCQDRVKRMVESFLPMIKDVEGRSSIKDAITLAIEKSTQGKPFDCVIMDSPLPETVSEMIIAIEKNPKLSNLRILLLIAPTLNNIRRHLSNSAITTVVNQDSPEVTLLHHIFHPLVARLSKPVRRLKLLNALFKLLTESAVAALSLTESDSTIPNGRVSGSVTPVHRSSSTGHLNMDVSSYSRQNQDSFSPEELAVFKGQKILVAEDNVIAQRLIVKQLAKLGFVVDKCNNGLECFDTWKQNGNGYYILAWIDHHMPKCDGLEATRMIRRHEQEMKHTTALPIIALTGKTRFALYYLILLLIRFLSNHS